MYKANFIHKLSEVDDFEQGCTGQASDNSYRFPIENHTREGFLQEFATHCGVDVNDLQIDPCGDDPSRVEAQTLEDGNGNQATLYQQEEWKRGELTLYACTYTVYVEFVTRAPANMNTKGE